MPFNAPQNLLSFPVVIDATNAEAFLVRKAGDTGDVLVVDTRDPTTSGFKDTVIMRAGGGLIAGSANNVSAGRGLVELSSGTQSENLVGFQGEVNITGNATLTGGGKSIRGGTFTVTHNSTGTVTNIIGLNNSARLNSSTDAVAVGTATNVYGFRSFIGYVNSPLGTGAITNGYGAYIIKPQATDANHTIATNYGLYIEDQTATGITKGYAIRTGTGLVEFGGRMLTNKGANVASTGNLAVGIGGNYFLITGTTQINRLSATDWKAGSFVVLEFDNTVTVKHGGAGTGAQIALSGSVDFVATAGDTLMLAYNGTLWREVSRTVI